MDWSRIESLIGLKIPEPHKKSMMDPDDPIHDACDFLLPDCKYELLDLVKVNCFLHSRERPDPWPDYLVAFASNGCGDYFAYDKRIESWPIVYIDPYECVSEALVADDCLRYPDFETWRARQVGRLRRHGDPDTKV